MQKESLEILDLPPDFVGENENALCELLTQQIGGKLIGITLVHLPVSSQGNHQLFIRNYLYYNILYSAVFKAERTS